MAMPKENSVLSKFTVVDSAVPEYFFDERTKFYWLRNRAGVWVSVKEMSFKRYLTRLGLSDFKQGDQTLSELDAAVCETEFENRVAYAGPLAGHWAGPKNVCGNLVLITEDPKLIAPIQPKESEAVLPEGELIFGKYDCRGWPTVGKIMKNLLWHESVGDVQLERYFGYVRHILDCLYDKELSKVIALMIAGERECGKTLLFNDIHSQLFGGKIAKPYDWMIGKENFNGELLGSVLLTVDDEVNNTHMDARNTLGEKLKKMVANSEQRIRGMHREGFTVNPLWAPTVMVNLEPANLLILPPIEEDNADKFMIWKAFKKPMPMAAETVTQRKAFWSRIMHELPRFVWWLRNEWETPEAIQGRFGVRHWHHPEIVEQLMKLSPAWVLWEMIKRTVFVDTTMYQNPKTKELFEGNEWMGTIEDLRVYLTDTKYEEGGRPKLSMEEARTLPTSQWLAKRLTSLAKKFPENIYQERTNKTRYWHIKAPEDAEE